MHLTTIGKLSRSSELITEFKASLRQLCPGALEIWAVLAGSGITVGIASFFADWALSEQLQLLSAVSFTGALVWVYGILLAGTGRGALMRLAMVITIAALASSQDIDFLAASFLFHALAAAQVSSRLTRRQDKVALLGWTGGALSLALVILIGLV